MANHLIADGAHDHAVHSAESTRPHDRQAGTDVVDRRQQPAHGVAEHCMGTRAEPMVAHDPHGDVGVLARRGEHLVLDLR